MKITDHSPQRRSSTFQDLKQGDVFKFGGNSVQMVTNERSCYDDIECVNLESGKRDTWAFGKNSITIYDAELCITKR